MIDSTLDFEAVKNKEFIVKAEYDAQLLELRKEMKEVEDSINSTLNDVVEDLDSPGIKLEYDNTVGYHYRLTRKQEKNLRHKKGYNIIDTKASGVRFQSSDLKSMNEQYMSQKKSYEEMQKAFVEEIINVAVSYLPAMKMLNNTIAWLDVSLAFSRVSVNAPKRYVRPKLREKGECCIILKQARHPVLESKVGNFIPNDVTITK
ncbi:DNA mismatch repair protein Msh2-like, partial [Uloborus diversus]